MTPGIKESSLNKESNDELGVANGAVNVLAADVLDIGYG
jgi:hypothetical protein